VKNGLRLDMLLVERGLAASRERARALILAGDVRVNGQPVTKAGTAVARDAAFGIDAKGRLALDIGASTGGFTDVLLQRGAARVVALDVGHGQLDWKIRSDPRVDVVERMNARALTPSMLPGSVTAFDVVTIDVSFISLRHILPVVPPLLRPGADVVALVKPQFEAGRAEVGKGGVVRDAAVRDRVVGDIVSAADALGLVRFGLAESPIAGMEGNVEFLLHLRQVH